MIEQLKTIREALLLRDMESCEEALAVLDQLEAMVGAQEPVAWMAQFINRSGKPDVYVTTHKYLAIENDDNGDPKPLVFGAAPVAQHPQGEVVVTWNYDRTRILAVTRQDREGRILKVIAEAPAQQPQAKPHKPLFADLIAQHPGLREELLEMDKQPQAEAVPTIYVSRGQLENLKPDPEDEAGTYLPVRKTPKGKFTHPLFAAPQQAEAAPPINDL